MSSVLTPIEPYRLAQQTTERPTVSDRTVFKAKKLPQGYNLSVRISPRRKGKSLTFVLPLIIYLVIYSWQKYNAFLKDSFFPCLKQWAMDYQPTSNLRPPPKIPPLLFKIIKLGKLCNQFSKQTIRSLFLH